MTIHEYDVSEEMKDLMVEFQVAEECKEKAIKSVFRARRAIYYGKVADKARRKFWKLVRELYPNLRDDDISYHFTDQILTITTDDVPDLTVVK